MNRIEAFNALFGSNQGTTASQEALDALGENMRPTADEESAIDTEALDNVSDFVDNPVAYLARFPDGNVKTLLQKYLESHQVKPSGPASRSEPVKPAPTSIPVDPLAGLGSSRPAAPKPAADITPKVERKPSGEKAPEGSAAKRPDLRSGRDRQPRGDARSEARIEPPPSDPPPPMSPITQDLRVMLDDPLWVAMRDQICRAHEANDRAALLRFRTMADSFKTGANANSGPRRLIGQLMILLLADLNSGLDKKTPVEYMTRYWS